MTSKLKCPFCGGEFDIISIKRKMLGCPKCLHIADGAFWKKAIQAKQDLEIARKALEELWQATHYDTDGYLGKTIQQALKQITHDNSEKPNSQEHKE